jgi:hypothetical protein
MPYAIQGIATEFGRCIQHGDKIIYLNSGCFADLGDVKFLYDHDPDKEVYRNRNLELFAGAKSLAFRMVLPEFRNTPGDLSDVSDDYDTYMPVSVGYKDAVTETVTIEGVEIKRVVKAALHEISLLEGTPAVNTTYARIVDMDKCGTLADDYDMIRLVGRYVNIHREVKARENNGVVKYGHTTSPYDRAANNFERALQRLNS